MRHKVGMLSFVIQTGLSPKDFYSIMINLFSYKKFAAICTTQMSHQIREFLAVCSAYFCSLNYLFAVFCISFMVAISLGKICTSWLKSVWKWYFGRTKCDVLSRHIRYLQFLGTKIHFYRLHIYTAEIVSEPWPLCAPISETLRLIFG